MHENEVTAERALLVSVDTGEFDAEASMAELYELVRSAGAEPFGSMMQKRPSPETATCVGSGMIQQIAEFCQQQEIDLLVFDRELTPTQIRNIEKITDVHTIDRTNHNEKQQRHSQPANIQAVAMHKRNLQRKRNIRIPDQIKSKDCCHYNLQCHLLFWEKTIRAA